MSRTIELSDEQYAALETAAAKSGETPQALVDRWLRTLAESHNRIYYDEEEMFAALDAYAAQADQLKRQWRADADE